MTHKIDKFIVAKSLIWTFLEKGGAQGIQLIISIVLARLLAPAEYGIIALVTIFLQLAAAFIQTGFGTALIQKQEVNHVDFSTVFYLSLFIAVICYIILFLSAPFIASFYNQDILVQVLRVLGLSCFSTAINCPQYAYISKYMKFKSRFYSSTIANFISGIVGIILAYRGLGVWALVVQQLLYGYITFTILFFTVRWHPTLAFSFEKMKYIVKFSYKLLISTLLSTVIGGLNSLIIGKFYTGTQLGVYSKGQHFPNFISSNLIGAIQTVSLPTFSAFNTNLEQQKKYIKRFISLSTYILMPCMFGLAAIASPLVQVLLSDQWIGCIPYLQLGCISWAFLSINSSSISSINAMGRSDIYLKLEIIKNIITIAVLVFTAPLGVMAIAIGQTSVYLLTVFIDSFPNKSLFNYPLSEEILDFLPPLLLSIFMALIIYPIQFLDIPNVIILFFQIISGVVIYIILSVLFKLDAYVYIITFVREIRRKKNLPSKKVI